MVRVATCLAVAVAARAQCAPVVLPGEGVPGLDRTVSAVIEWDPDGAGPLSARLVLGGSFRVAGNLVANRIAAWDPATGEWSTFGAGLNDTVQALAVLPNGDLVAAGLLTDGASVNHRTVVRWDGTSWQALGAGFVHGQGASIHALRVLPNGDLLAAGQLAAVGSTVLGNVARWDGTAWSPMGLTAALGQAGGVKALATLSNGTLVAGGGNAVQQWTGSDWSPLGTATLNGVNTLLALPNGQLLAGTRGSSHPGYPPEIGVRVWDGSSWSTPAGAPAASVQGFAVAANGDVLCGGRFEPWNQAVLRRWNGSSWSDVSPVPPAGGISSIAALANGDLLIAGDFPSVGNLPAANIARLSGGVWNALGSGVFGSQITVLRTLRNGDLVAAGQLASGVAVARRSGGTWTELGAFPPVMLPFCLAELANGDLVVGGYSWAGPLLLRWDGAAWTQIGSPDSLVAAVCELPSGDLAVACLSGLFVGAGSTWTEPGGGVGSSAYALALLPDGDLLVGGAFTSAGGLPANRVARWDGSAWHTLGAGVNGDVQTMSALANGDLVVAGGFTVAGASPANGIARWNGSSWSAQGSGPGAGGHVAAIVELPNGDLVVAGTFPSMGGVAAANVARWNGAAWSDFTSGSNAAIRAVAWSPSGSVAVGGDFTTMGGQVAPSLAVIGTTCPPAIVALGPGCPGSGGSSALAVMTLPWVDATFRAEATGLPTVSLALAVTSVSAIVPAFPLAGVFPQAPAGCDAHVAPDILGLLLPTAGTVRSQLFLPDTPPLVGVTFHHQLVVFELDALGGFAEVTATNALSLTVGSF
jgi:hypothetical protein